LLSEAVSNCLEKVLTALMLLSDYL
jgi:hypothetical protein